MSIKHSHIQSQVEEISKKDGRNTELVSVYIPSDGSIQQMFQQLQQEISEAKNIKSKQTRNNVQDALKRITSILSQYTEVPENGIAIFAGVVESEMQTYILDSLPSPIQSKVYHCNDTFFVKPLEDIFNSGEKYIAITIDRGDAAIGYTMGTNVVTSQTVHTPVPGKQKKGGQSQQRFERLRVEATETHYKRVANKATDQFLEERHDIRGILIGGPDITRKEFISGEYLHHELQHKICFQSSVTAVETGIEELVENAQSTIESKELQHAQTTVNTFFENIADGKSVYGYDEVMQAIEYGAVETVVLSESYYPFTEKYQQLVDAAEEYGGSVTIIPESFELGSQFKQGFGGVGAILRYPIN